MRWKASRTLDLSFIDARGIDSCWLPSRDSLIRPLEWHCSGLSAWNSFCSVLFGIVLLCCSVLRSWAALLIRETVRQGENERQCQTDVEQHVQVHLAMNWRWPSVVPSRTNRNRPGQWIEYYDVWSVQQEHHSKMESLRDGEYGSDRPVAFPLESFGDEKHYVHSKKRSSYSCSRAVRWTVGMSHLTVVFEGRFAHRL